MYQIKLIAHKEITENELNEVVKIKSAQWHYSYNEQLEWIKKNIKDLDIHVLLSSDGRNVAYLNLIDIDLFVEEIPVKGFGIGNVCAIEKGNGFGFELMKEVNETIIRLNKVGLLFCKEPLLKYYSSLGWVELRSTEYKINCEGSKVMVFNSRNGSFVRYEGILF
ncbi:hypothetical protein ACNPMW_06060 [Acinetobacter junii]|jgi:hypothetical protein|uniref:hypothetical protein n=1 Tax=Acinetobacter junii TaxID=40215 RepID=UPI003AA7E2A9